MNPASHFTGAQIARALGSKRQAIARALAGIAPDGAAMVSGNEAGTWLFVSLPARLQVDLNTTAQRRGYRSAEAMLTAPAEPLLPEFSARLRECPLAQMRAEFVSRALKLRDALAAPLAQQHTLGNAALTELGRREFTRVFGYPVSAKHWNRIFSRTVLRDNGAEQFHRAELYVDDAAFQKPIARVALVAKRYDHSALADLLKDLASKAQLSSGDRGQIFTAAFFHAEKLWENLAANERAGAKASVIAFLRSTFPPLAKSLEGLCRTFERRLQIWIAGGRTMESQQDGRRLTSGNFRRPDFTEDDNKIRDYAVKLHKNETLAHRRLRQRGELSKEYVDYYSSFDIRVNKSAVPAATRKAITPQVEAAVVYYKGEREARLHGPSIPRDWSGVLPGDYISGDDTTLNHPFSTPNGRGGLDILRGEFLLINDLRTGFPLDHQLIAGHYNGRHIASGLLRVHDNGGLARKGGYWEKGVWESRWMPGVPKKHSRHWRDTELPLRAAGFDMGCLQDFERRHAISPRSKPIERAFHSIQSMMTDQPAYLGRNERLDNFKPLQDFIARCRRGTEDPRSEGIMPMEDWMKKIGAVLEEYADEPQNGKMLPGVSPREMWEDALSKHPLRKLSTAQRIALMTNHQIFKTIPSTGIVLRAVPQFVYCNEELGRWRMQGRPIVTFYNIDVPELLTVSNMEATEFFTIKGTGLDAMNATNEQQRSANQQIRGFMKPARVLFGQITQRKKFTITKDAPADSPFTALGEFHNAEVQAHTAEKSARTRKLRKIQTAAAVAGTSFVGPIRNPDRVLEGQEVTRKYRARLAAKEQNL